MTYKATNGLVYELNSETNTALVTRSNEAKGNIIIPCSVNYQNKDYAIVGIKEDSFFQNENIISLCFQNGSHIRSIEKDSFIFSNLMHLQIPKSLQKLENCWCSITEKLITVDLSPENENFKYLDEDHKIILGKSDPNSKIFDVLEFACRDIKEVKIPSYIKIISGRAFGYCKQLTKIDFEPNSQLETIGEKCFEYCVFKSIKFPPSLKTIGTFIFSNAKIETCEFDENCPLEFIPKSAFLSSRIKQIFIPKNVSAFKFNWNFNTKLSTVNLSLQNQHLSFIDEEHKIIAGKTDINSTVFDIIYFACKDVKKAIIPSNIKHISWYAFLECHELKILQFEGGISTFCEECFKKCDKLTKVSLPAGLNRYERGIFECCTNLQSFEFLDREIYIDCSFFSGCKNLVEINCPNAEKIIYDDNSFKYVAPNVSVNRPPNAVFSSEKSDENDKIREKGSWD